MDAIRFTNKLNFLREYCLRTNTTVSVKNSLVFPPLKRQQQFQNTARRLPSSLFCLVSSVWKSDSLSDEVQRRWIAAQWSRNELTPTLNTTFLQLAFYRYIIYICCCQLFNSGNFYFSFVSTSLAYTAIPKNKRKIKTKIIRDKKINYNIHTLRRVHLPYLSKQGHKPKTLHWRANQNVVNPVIQWGLVRTSSTLIQKYLNTLRFRFKLFHALSIVYSFSRGDCSYQATMHV